MQVVESCTVCIACLLTVVVALIRYILPRVRGRRRPERRGLARLYRRQLRLRAYLAWHPCPWQPAGPTCRLHERHTAKSAHSSSASAGQAGTGRCSNGQLHTVGLLPQPWTIDANEPRLHGQDAHFGREHLTTPVGGGDWQLPVDQTLLELFVPVVRMEAGTPLGSDWRGPDTWRLRFRGTGGLLQRTVPRSQTRLPRGAPGRRGSRCRLGGRRPTSACRRRLLWWPAPPVAAKGDGPT